ncbi:MAG TPA: lipoyl synthase, partial [Chloroflexota bacterium]|nr:lipoyl synthase [Chloroflexota bacterium]
ARAPGTAVEVLVPDFGGNWDALGLVMDAHPDVLNHNVETVPRLYGRARPRAVYARSLELLRRAKTLDPAAITKSGIMVGLGETETELESTFADLASAQVDILTIGQYLRPSVWHLPVAAYYPPDAFDRFRETAKGLGFRHVEAGPLVRSSYHAHEQTAAAGGER